MSTSLNPLRIKISLIPPHLRRLAHSPLLLLRLSSVHTPPGFSLSSFYSSTRYVGPIVLWGFEGILLRPNHNLGCIVSNAYGLGNCKPLSVCM